MFTTYLGNEKQASHIDILIFFFVVMIMTSVAKLVASGYLDNVMISKNFLDPMFPPFKSSVGENDFLSGCQN